MWDEKNHIRYIKHVDANGTVNNKKHFVLLVTSTSV